jgi:hypothetical protein
VLCGLEIARMDVAGSVHLSVLNSITSILIMKLPIVAVLFCVLPPLFVLGHNKSEVKYCVQSI